MKFAVLGTGMVGKALATRLAGLGHPVMMGARDPGNPVAAEWAAGAGAQARHGSFAEAAAFAEMGILAVRGDAALDVVALAGPDNLAGKVLIDVTNPLDLSRGFPPPLLPEFANTTSLGEAVQAAAPGARVVKALNTVNCQLMVDPSRVPGETDLFIAGADAAAKEAVADLLRSFGWAAPIDLGGIDGARATEGMMPLWLRLYGAFGTADFNYRIVRGG